MLANAVLMFTSKSILHHPSFMKKESGGGGGDEVVKQRRGAINLAVTFRGTMLLHRWPILQQPTFICERTNLRALIKEADETNRAQADRSRE